MPHNENSNGYTSTILAVRGVEDCIRATTKYTEGISTMRKKHPIQGDEFPSKTFCKYYEVYPEVDLDEIRSLFGAVDTTLSWLSQETSCVDVIFKYDYRQNKASIVIKDGPIAIRELAKGIPGFSEALAKVVAIGNGKAHKI